MRPNQATIAIIQEFEGCRLEAYRDIVGVWTIGWGHAATSRLEPIPKSGMKITQAEADALHAKDLEHFGHKILPLMSRQPTPNQFGAMLSLSYNIGVGAFRKSTCLRRFNEGDIEGAADALQWFNKAGGKKVRGLVRRRAAEADLFLQDAQTDFTADIATPDKEKTIGSSKTILATVGAALSGGASALTSLSALEGATQIVVIVLSFVTLFGLALIFRERLKKLAEGS